jgi:hypothetical protein
MIKQNTWATGLSSLSDFFINYLDNVNRSLILLLLQFRISTNRLFASYFFLLASQFAYKKNKRQIG